MVVGRRSGLGALLVLEGGPVVHHVGARDALVLGHPHALDVGRHALAHPHVAPVDGGDQVAVPLVDDLVHQHPRRRGVAGVAERDHGLGLHAALGVHDQDAERVERVGPEAVLDPRERLRRAPHPAQQVGPVRRRPVADRHARLRLVRGHREVAERHRDEVRRRRGAQPPAGDRVAAGPLPGQQLAVGDAHERRRHPQREVVERLVRGLVVHGVPGVGAVRLLHRPGAAVGGDRPARRAEVVPLHRRGHRPWVAAVADHQRVPAVPGHRRLDEEVLAAVLVRRVRAVEREPLDLERPGEVELEVVGVGRRTQLERLDRLEPARVGGPVQPQVVVQRIDPGVADVGVDPVLDRRAEALGRVPRLLSGGGRRGLRGRRGRPVALGGAAREQQRAREQGGDRPHSPPRRRGRASRRPWWICAFTVPSGASTSWAISS